MPADEDIMDQLRKIDEDEILSEEIDLDDDLNFDGLGDMDNESPPVATIAPPSPRTEASGGDAESSGGDAESNVGEAESSGGGADTDSAVPAAKPVAKKASKSKSSRPKTTKPAQEPPAQADTSVTEVGEVIVRAKTLRIIAEKVIIEPGNISFSP